MRIMSHILRLTNILIPIGDLVYSLLTQHPGDPSHPRTTAHDSRLEIHSQSGAPKRHHGTHGEQENLLDQNQPEGCHPRSVDLLPIPGQIRLNIYCIRI
jgi:hypothetical protein